MLDILAFFVAGEDGLLDLLRDPNHLLFEFITGGVETLVVDGLLVAVVWPTVLRHLHRDAPHVDVREEAPGPVRVVDIREWAAPSMKLHLDAEQRQHIQYHKDGAAHFHYAGDEGWT